MSKRMERRIKGWKAKADVSGKIYRDSSESTSIYSPTFRWGSRDFPENRDIQFLARKVR